MKSDKKILIAFILNLAFSIFEFVGGIFTGSVAIISDSVHDIGDAASIGISYFLEKKSKKQPNEKYTYGYARYSVIGSVITTLILLFGSAMVIYNAVLRIIDPTEINYNGMIIFALFGVVVNFLAKKIPTPTMGAGMIKIAHKKTNATVDQRRMCILYHKSYKKSSL
jgi:cobalt-zinc-cadmium efflux system protein